LLTWDAGSRHAWSRWRFQSGVINDYVAWIVLGLAAIGGVLAPIIGWPALTLTSPR